MPEAIDWHYGGSWVHIFPHKTTEELEKSFQETGDLLRKSICLNISLNMTAQSISEIAQIIQDFCNTI